MLARMLHHHHGHHGHHRHQHGRTVSELTDLEHCNPARCRCCGVPVSNDVAAHKAKLGVHATAGLKERRAARTVGSETEGLRSDHGHGHGQEHTGTDHGRNAHHGCCLRARAHTLALATGSACARNGPHHLHNTAPRPDGRGFSRHCTKNLYYQHDHHAHVPPCTGRWSPVYCSSVCRGTAQHPRCVRGRGRSGGSLTTRPPPLRQSARRWCYRKKLQQSNSSDPVSIEENTASVSGVRTNMCNTVESTNEQERAERATRTGAAGVSGGVENQYPFMHDYDLFALTLLLHCSGKARQFTQSEAKKTQTFQYA